MKTTISILLCMSLTAMVIQSGPPAFAQTPPDEVQNRIAETADNARDFRLKLRQTGISSIPESEDSLEKEQLQQLIDQVNALELPKSKQTIADDTKHVEPAEKASATPETSTSQTAQEKSSAENEQENHKNKQLDAILTDKPQDIVNPMEVGESLFKMGELKDAVKFYRLALERMAENKDDPDRPWLLFQIANCLRHDDPDTAYSVYQELITEHPSSSWTPSARAQQQIILWYREATPITVLEKYSSDPNSL